MRSPPINWSAVVELHGPDVWRTAFRLLSNHDDASDCYQETFLKAVAYARCNEIASWSATLKRIATARAIDQLRRRYRRAGRSQQLSLVESTSAPTASSPAPDEMSDLRESMEILREALTKIPPAQAEAFWLTEIEMLDRVDVAAEMEATPQQVATWLHRAKQKLRKYLAERGVTSEVRK